MRTTRGTQFRVRAILRVLKAAGQPRTVHEITRQLVKDGDLGSVKDPYAVVAYTLREMRGDSVKCQYSHPDRPDAQPGALVYWPVK